MDQRFAALALFWFTAWTVISFMAHFFAKKSFNAIEDHESSPPGPLWFLAVSLTTTQTFIGSLVLFVLLHVPRLRNMIAQADGQLPITSLTPPNGVSTSTPDSSSKQSAPSPPLRQSSSSSKEEFYASMKSIVLSHVTATLFTNASLAFGSAGSAFTVKAFEPITTAILTSLLLGGKQDASVIASLPLVVSGAIGFVWQPGLKTAGVFSLGLAFSSNVLYGIRNINIKQTHKQVSGGSGTSMLAKLTLIYRMSAYTTVVLVGPAFAAGLYYQSVPISFFFCIYSGMCHITYTVISTCLILKFVSVVGHATFNLMKRLIVAGVFFALGHRVPTNENWMMLVILFAGLLIYTFPSLMEQTGLNNPSLLLVVTCTLIVALASGMFETPTASDPAVQGQPVVPLKETLPIAQLPMSKTIPELSNDDFEFMKNVKVYNEPESANRVSNKLTTTTGIIEEARRIHDQVFPFITSGYKRAVLVNVFQWANKGDHLITIGQRKILDRLGIKIIYHCYYPGRDCKFSKLPRDNDVIVLVQGAGYIGHPAHKYVLDNTIANFPNNRVMVFPISVCHPTKPCDQIQEFAEIFAKHKDVHVVFRDRYSYDLGVKHFKNVKNYLAPDSAFAVGPIRLNINPVYDIIWLKRDDWEGQGDAMPEFPPGLKVQVTDWIDDWMKTTSDNFWEDHQLRTMSGVAFLARGRVVVSDRLHAHLMSQLMDKPNVAINSRTHKAEHYFTTWEASTKRSRLVNSNKEALAAALELLEELKKSKN